MKKQNLKWFDRENPERIAIARYRNPENIHKEEVLQEFLEFVDNFLEDMDDEYGREKLSLISQINNLTYAYLGYDEEKVQQGEQTLLTRWIQSVKGE